MSEDDQPESIPDDGDNRRPFLPYKRGRTTRESSPPRKSTRRAVVDIEKLGSLADLHDLHHASRDRWRDPEIDS